MFAFLLSVSFCLVLSIFVVNGQIPLKSPHEAKGVVLLDSFTFPKLVPSDKHMFVVLVTNKRSIGDYNTDSVRADFFAFSTYVQTHEDSNADDIVFAQVIVNGAENAKLAEKMGVAPNSLKTRMFLYPINATNPIAYPETSPFQMQELLRFITQNSHYNYRMSGTLAHYDALMKEVVSHLNPEGGKIVEDGPLEADQIFQEFYNRAKEIHAIYEKTFKTIASPESKKGEKLTELDMSNVYMNAFEKLIKTGKQFIQKEIERLSEILDEKKISKFTRTKLKYQVNVLKTFLDSKAGTASKEDEKKKSNDGAEF